MGRKRTPRRRIRAEAQFPSKPAISETHLPKLKLKARGKVRDINNLGDTLLLVATDRIFAFGVIMPSPIPDKGRMLTPDSSRFWPKDRYLTDGPQPSLDRQF